MSEKLYICYAFAFKKFGTIGIQTQVEDYKDSATQCNLLLNTFATF